MEAARPAQPRPADVSKEAKAEQWQLENRAAIESSNAYVVKYGLPLAKFRQF